jgi:hypothetical protein
MNDACERSLMGKKRGNLDPSTGVIEEKKDNKT